MAKYRQVHTHMWKDSWFLELEPKQKLFFIYLFTNERASISGMYELSKKVMAFESGLTLKEIDAAFAVFAEQERAFYEDGVVWVINLRKYHETASPKIQKAIEDDLKKIKDTVLKNEYMKRYGMDRVSSDEDTVSILRSSYSSSISSSSSSENGNGEDEIASRTHGGETIRIKTHAGIADEVVEQENWGDINSMITTIAKHIKTACTELNYHEFKAAALYLIEEGITQQNIEDAWPRYWEKNCFYDPPSRATLKTFQDNIKEAVRPFKAEKKDWSDDYDFSKIG